MLRRNLLPLLLLIVGACSPAYAPPIRGLHSGMPGRLAAGQLELGGTAGGYILPTAGGPHLAFGFTDSLLVEAGANLNLVEGVTSNWATGWAGVRLTREKPLGHGLRLVGDLELGAGAGVGGRINADAAEWTKLGAVGIYEGFGVGVQWRALGLYARGRLDAAASSRAPTTLWPTAMLGLEVRPTRWLAIGAGGGYAGYWNDRDHLVSAWFYEAQVALIFDVMGQPGLTRR